MKYIYIILCILMLSTLLKAQSVVQAEYFFDGNDSGYGLCNPITLIQSADSTWQLPSIPTTGLSAGNHKLYTRVKDNNNQWSHTTKRNVEIVIEPSIFDVVNVECFFGLDNGYGSPANINFTLTPSSDSTWTFIIPYAQVPLPSSPDSMFYIRVKDASNGKWSHTTQKLVKISNCSLSISAALNGGTFTATSNLVGTTYQWVDCNNGNSPIVGAVNQTYTPLVNGDYAVVANYNGCSDTSQCITILNVGIGELFSNSSVVLSPNPATDKLIIQMEKSTNYIYEIFDLLGKHYLNGKSNSQQNQIDVSNLPIGLYLINIKTDAGKFIHKFIKQ